MDDRLRESLQKLETAVPKERMDEKLLFAAKTGRPNFRNKIYKVSEAIRNHVEFDFHSFTEYYNQCVFAVNQANALAVTEFRTIGIVFEREAHDVVNNLRRLKELLSESGAKIKEHQKNLDPYSEILEHLHDLRNSLDKLAVHKIGEYEMKKEIEEKEEKKNETRKSIEELINSEEWKRYESTIERRNEMKRKESEIRTRFNEKISSLERPLKKAKRVADEDQEDTQSKKMFEEYLKNPSEAFLKDEDGKMLKELLNRTRKLLEENKVNIRENVKEKAIEKIDELVYGNSLQKWKEEYQSVIKEMEIEESPLPAKKVELEKKVQEIEREISEDMKRAETIGKQIEQERGLIKKKLEELDGKFKSFYPNYELEVNY